jgi:type I restriction enzyme R subunit
MSFEQVAQDLLHDMIESNFKFYRKVQDDQDVSKELFDHLFERYYERKGLPEGEAEKKLEHGKGGHS